MNMQMNERRSLKWWYNFWHEFKLCYAKLYHIIEIGIISNYVYECVCVCICVYVYVRMYQYVCQNPLGIMKMIDYLVIYFIWFSGNANPRFPEEDTNHNIWQELTALGGEIMDVFFFLSFSKLFLWRVRIFDLSYLLTALKDLDILAFKTLVVVNIISFVCRSNKEA